MKGFTLIELLVVISIMAILVVVAVPSYNAYNNNQRLNDAARQLQTILRQAQNNAQTGTVCGGIVKAISWDVRLRTDPLNNRIYSFLPVCEDGGIRSPQTTTLPVNVIVSGISIDTRSSTCSSTNISVQFKNVSSEITFIDNNLGCPDATNAKLKITLSLTGSSNTKKVVVEKGGGIYVEQ